MDSTFRPKRPALDKALSLEVEKPQALALKDSTAPDWKVGDKILYRLPPWKSSRLCKILTVEHDRITYESTAEWVPGQNGSYGIILKERVHDTIMASDMQFVQKYDEPDPNAGFFVISRPVFVGKLPTRGTISRLTPEETYNFGRWLSAIGTPKGKR